MTDRDVVERAATLLERAVVPVRRASSATGCRTSSA